LVIAIVVLVSIFACERETPPDSSSARPPVKASKPVPAKPPSQALRETAPPKAPAPQPVDFKKLVGRWVRTDSPYVIEIRAARDDGTLEAAYYNPRPINIARAEARKKSHGLEVFVEMDDVNYRGSTYTLTYDRANDQLKGVYFQATMRQSYNISFTRQQSQR
jgi:hypothetical protein